MLMLLRGWVSAPAVSFWPAFRVPLPKRGQSACASQVSEGKYDLSWDMAGGQTLESARVFTPLLERKSPFLMLWSLLFACRRRWRLASVGLLWGHQQLEFWERLLVVTHPPWQPSPGGAMSKRLRDAEISIYRALPRGLGKDPDVASRESWAGSEGFQIAFLNPHKKKLRVLGKALCCENSGLTPCTKPRQCSPKHPVLTRKFFNQKCPTQSYWTSKVFLAKSSLLQHPCHSGHSLQLHIHQYILVT